LFLIYSGFGLTRTATRSANEVKISYAETRNLTPDTSLDSPNVEYSDGARDLTRPR